MTKWMSLRADLIPDALDDCVVKQQVQFNGSKDVGRPELVYHMIPLTYPKANPVAAYGWAQFPGIGRLDLVSWARENKLWLSTPGRLLMCVRVSANLRSLDADDVYESDRYLLPHSEQSFASPSDVKAV